MKKLNDVLASALRIDQSDLKDELAPGDLDSWDSLGHLHLISAIEEEYDLEFEMEQVEEMESIGKIKEILQNLGVSE